MSDSHNDFETLARAFATRRPPSPGKLNQCPAPEQLFEAASGALELRQRLKIVDHVSQCADCSQAWRLAMQLGARPANAAGQSGTALLPSLHWPTSRSLRAHSVAMRRFALAASILCAVGIAGYLFIPEEQQPPRYRDAANPLAPVSLVTGSLARDRFLLRWSAGPQGSTYVVRLTKPDLVPLLVKQDVASPEFLVPDTVLAEVTSGEELLWQIEIRLPNGQRIASETYVVTLE